MRYKCKLFEHSNCSYVNFALTHCYLDITTYMEIWYQILMYVFCSTLLGYQFLKFYPGMFEHCPCWKLSLRPDDCHFADGIFNSLAPGKFEWNFRYLIFQIISVIDSWGISYELALMMNGTRPYWWKVNIGSGNGLVPSGNKPLLEPMLTQISVAIWHH